MQFRFQPAFDLVDNLPDDTRVALVFSGSAPRRDSMGADEVDVRFDCREQFGLEQHAP